MNAHKHFFSMHNLIFITKFLYYCISAVAIGKFINYIYEKMIIPDIRKLKWYYHIIFFLCQILLVVFINAYVVDYPINYILSENKNSNYLKNILNGVPNNIVKNLYKNVNKNCKVDNPDNSKMLFVFLLINSQDYLKHYLQELIFVPARNFVLSEKSDPMQIYLKKIYKLYN